MMNGETAYDNGYKVGYNLGYGQNKAEAAALAQANSELRSLVLELGRLIRERAPYGELEGLLKAAGT